MPTPASHLPGLSVAGDVLQVSGEARIVYEEEHNGGDDPALSGSTGKYVRIDVLAVIEAQAASPLRMRMEELSPYSPAVPSPAQQQQQQQPTASFLVRCTQALDVASGVKAFRFEPVVAAEAAGTPNKGDDGGKGKALAWNPGQVGEGVSLQQWRLRCGRPIPSLL